MKWKQFFTIKFVPEYEYEWYAVRLEDAALFRAPTTCGDRDNYKCTSRVATPFSDNPSTTRSGDDRLLTNHAEPRQWGVIFA